MTKIGLAETVPAPCENEEVSLGSALKRKREGLGKNGNEKDKGEKGDTKKR